MKKRKLQGCCLLRGEDTRASALKIHHRKVREFEDGVLGNSGRHTMGNDGALDPATIQSPGVCKETSGLA